MTPREALAWAFKVAEESMGPFQGSFDQRDQTADWYCRGCLGIFRSAWPDWTLPTDETFPHEAGCKYLAAREALNDAP